MLRTWILQTIAILLAAWLLAGVHVENWFYGAVAALVLGFLNSLVRPLLIILTIPITILSLGLFILVINTVVVLMASYLAPGFQVDGFWWALAFSFVMSVLGGILK